MNMSKIKLADIKHSIGNFILEIHSKEECTATGIIVFKIFINLTVLGDYCHQVSKSKVKNIYCHRDLPGLQLYLTPCYIFSIYF